MTAQHLQDLSKGKYFHQMLNMADDDLNPYEYRLLGHYIRVAAKKGRCWESVRTTAMTTRMSAGMVVKTRNKLEELKYIRVKHRDEDTCVISIIDRMKENVARYADLPDEEDDDLERSPHEHPVHHMNTLELVGVHQVKQRRIRTKEEDKELIAPAIADRERAASPSHTPSVADEADDASMFKKPSTRQLSAQAENGTKRLTAAQSPSPSLKQKPPTAENTTAPIPQIAPAPLSPSSEMQAAPEAIEKGVSVTPEKKVAKRSEKQMINDARIEALRVALAVGRGKEPIALQGREISNYSKVANELVDGGVPVEDFLPYVQYWNKAAQGWPGGLTLNSLIKPGRITDFKTWYKPRKKPISGDSSDGQVYPIQTGAKRGYSRENDPAYAHLYANPEQVKHAK